MSELMKWLDKVSVEDVDSSVNLKVEDNMKEDVVVDEAGVAEQLSDDPSTTEAKVELEADASAEDQAGDDDVSKAADDITMKPSTEDSAADEDDVATDAEVEDEPVVAESVDEVEQVEEVTEPEAEPVVDEVKEPATDTDIVVDAEVEEPVAEADVVEEPATTEAGDSEEATDEVDVNVPDVVDEVEETVADEPVEDSVPVADVDDESVVESVIDTPVDTDAVELVEDGTDAEGEEPAVAVDPVAEIQDDEVAEAVAEAVAEEAFVTEDDDSITDEMDGVHQDVEDLSVMQTALEAYGELLEQELSDGGVVSPTLAKAIHIGLESFAEPILLQGMPSLEDYSDATGKFAVSNELLDNVKAKVGTVAEATMAAIQRLWELLEDIFRQFKANVPALQQKNDELSEKLKNTIDGSKGSVSMKGARRLYIGDMFAGNNPNNIKTVYQVGDKFMVLYPKMFREITKDYSQFAKQIANTDMEGLDVFGFITNTAKHFVPADLGMQKIDGSKAPSTMQKHLTHVASPVLLGNRRFFAGISMDVKGVKDSGDPVENRNSDTFITASLADIFKLEFGREQGVADSGSDDIIKLPDVDTLRQLAKETATLTKHLEKYSEAAGNFRQIRREMESITQTASLAVVAQGVTRAITVPTGHFVGYVGNMVRVLQAFIEYCIREHEASVIES